MDMYQFQRNRAQFPPDELAKYARRYVAWSPDGTQIIASADDPVQVDQAVKATSYDPADCVISYVPDPDEVILGGGAAL